MKRYTWIEKIKPRSSSSVFMVGVAAGAFAVILFIGSPELHESAAASWASAAATTFAASIAAALGWRGIREANKKQKGNTIALAAMARPFLENAASRLQELEACWGDDPIELYSTMLANTLSMRQELSTKGQYVTGQIGALLPNWGGADHLLVQRIAELSSLLNQVSNAARKPLSDASEEGQFLKGAEAYLVEFRRLVCEAQEKISEVTEMCNSYTSH